MAEDAGRRGGCQRPRAARLATHEIDFILVGGVAATLHGSTRLTQDLDIVYARSDDNIERLTCALADLSSYSRGAPPGLPFEWSRETLRNGLNFTLTTALGDIDVLLHRNATFLHESLTYS